MGLRSIARYALGFGIAAQRYAIASCNWLSLL